MSELTTLISPFQKFDANQDLRVVRSEATGMQAQLFDSIDTNKDGSLDLAEWFRYKKRNDLAGVTQNIFWRGVYDHTLTKLKDCGLSSPYDRIGILISLGIYLGVDFTTDKTRVSDFLYSAELDSQTALKALPAALEAMTKAGITDSRKIQSLIDDIGNYDQLSSGEALEALPAAITAMAKAGITNPEKIRHFIEKIVIYTGLNLARAFKALPPIIEATTKAGIKDPETIQSLIEKIVDNAGQWSGATFEVLPAAIDAMARAGITSPEKILSFIKKIVTAAGGHSAAALTAVSDLLGAGIRDPEKIRTLILKIIAASGRYSSATLEALPAVTEAITRAGIKDPATLQSLIEKTIAAAGKELTAAFYCLTAILSTSKADYAKPDNRKKLTEGLKFILSYSAGSTSSLMNIFPLLKLEIADIDYDTFPLALTSHLQKYIADHPGSVDRGLFTMLSVWINKIHDADTATNKKDRLRQGIADNLDFHSAYLLIALGGPDLYTSSFIKIWNGQTQRITDILTEIKKVDPQNKHVADFILTLCNFGKVDLLNAHPAFFLDKAIELLGKTDDIVRHSALLIKLFDALLPMCSADDKKRLAKFLNGAYRDGKKTKEYHGSMAYLIKLYAPRLENEDLKKIASTLPALFEPKVPRDQWLKDNAITAKLYFYPDENWYKWTGDYYQKMGWAKDTAYMKQHNMGDNDTVVFSKQVVDAHGEKIVLRVILTQSKNDSREASINNDEFDIIAHRGHSFHIRETFIKDMVIKAVGKLFFGGSCGSFRDMTDGDFLKEYSRNYLMADQDTGQGNANNDALTRLMEEIAKGSTEWSSSLGQGNEDNGLVLPDSPSFLIGEYLRRLK